MAWAVHMVWVAKMVCPMLPKEIVYLIIGLALSMEAAPARARRKEWRGEQREEEGGKCVIG